MTEESCVCSMGMQKATGFREVRDDKLQIQRQESMQAAAARVSEQPAVVHRLKAYRSVRCSR